MLLKLEKVEFPVLYSHCMLSKGYSRSIIIDLHYAKYQAIPNSIYEIFTECKGLNITQIKSKYDNKHDNTIDEYFDFLIDNDFIFFSIEPFSYPEISKIWESPKIITNGIIEVECLDDLTKQIQSFVLLKVSSLELRFYKKISLEELEKKIDSLQNSQIETFVLYLIYSKEFTKENLIQFSKGQSRLSSIIIYESPLEDSFKTDWLTNISYLKTTGILSEMCGMVHPNYFACNLPHFTESQHYNTCLNRKISIDVNGEIKNCPSIKKSFGNIKDTTLEEALEKPGFKDLWTIKKDDIEVCKDCEFRHICTDCRAFIKDPENIYSQPAKCPYNPYIAKWEGQEGYITVEESLKAMNSEQLIVNS